MLPDGFCPQPLLYRNTTDRITDIENGYNFVGETNCILPCPSPLFKSTQWDSYFLMSLVMGSISMFASLFLIITYSPLINKKHTRHTVGILCMSTGIFFIMVSDGRQLWDIETGVQKYCPEPGRYARQSDTKCLTTGLFFQFGCCTAILWWSILAVDLWMTIAKKVVTTKKQIIYYLIGLNSVALILTFAPVAKKQYGFGQAAIGCWLLTLNYQYGFFWIPVGICLTIGSIFIGLIFYEIYKISDAVKKKYLKKHIKPLCLIVLMCLEFFYMFIYYSYVTANQPKYNKSVAEYIMCLIVNAANVPSSYTCELKTVSPTAQFFFLIAIRIMGLQGLIFYGLTAATKKVWSESWFNKCFLKFIKQFISYYIINCGNPNTDSDNDSISYYSSTDNGSNYSSSNHHLHHHPHPHHLHAITPHNSTNKLFLTPKQQSESNLQQEQSIPSTNFNLTSSTITNTINNNNNTDDNNNNNNNTNDEVDLVSTPRINSNENQQP